MISPGTKQIETDRLILRRFIKDDAEAIYGSWGSDPMISRYLSWVPHSSITVTKAYLDNLIKSYRRPDSFHWCIVLKETGLMAGSIDVVKQNLSIKAAEVGYLIARPFWNKGYMTEALRAVVEYLFVNADYNRIEACHHIKNLASGHVMEKSGMIFEGISRDGARDNQSLFCDIARYAILRRDFVLAHDD